jgi:hypothetical protein
MPCCRSQVSGCLFDNLEFVVGTFRVIDYSGFGVRAYFIADHLHPGNSRFKADGIFLQSVIPCSRFPDDIILYQYIMRDSGYVDPAPPFHDPRYTVIFNNIVNDFSTVGTIGLGFNPEMNAMLRIFIDMIPGDQVIGVFMPGGYSIPFHPETVSVNDVICKFTLPYAPADIKSVRSVIVHDASSDDRPGTM